MGEQRSDMPLAIGSSPIFPIIFAGSPSVTVASGIKSPPIRNKDSDKNRIKHRGSLCFCALAD